MSSAVMSKQSTSNELTVLLDTEFIQKANSDATDEKSRIIEGYANFRVIDRIGDLILPEAFKSSIPTYMLNPQLRFNHEEGSSIGKVNEIKITDDGLWVSAEIGDWDLANEKWKQIEFGSLKAFSIMGRVLEWEEKKNPDGEWVYEITDFELVEISVVEIPMNQLSLFEMKSVAQLKDVKYLRAIKNLKDTLIKNHSGEQTMTEEQTEKPIEEPVEVEKADNEDSDTKADIEVIAEFVKSANERLDNLEERIKNLEQTENQEGTDESTDNEKSAEELDLLEKISAMMDEKLKTLLSATEKTEKSVRKTSSQFTNSSKETVESLADAIRKRLI